MTYIINGHTYTVSHPLFALLAVLVVWELIWKGIALWHAGRNNQMAWFVVMLILNTAGILEIVYLLFFAKKATKRKE